MSLTFPGRHFARVMAVGLGLHFKMLSRSPFDLFVVIASPLIFATLAYFLFKGESASSLLVAALASGVMGIWSSTTASGAGALQTQRRLGVLELLVASPTPFWAVVLPITVAISSIGIYSLAVGLLYVRLLFGVAITVHEWGAFLVAVPATIGSIGSLGFLFASALVRYRAAFQIGNIFEWPVWMICGLLIPVAVLPGWLQPVSWLFAPTWGMAALRGATLGSGSPWVDIGLCGGLAVAYLLAGVAFLHFFLRSARSRATLALS
ncbi:MAG TPA: ABC transporter permease [Gaiellaceae bacterium]|nr:ABC transporter permease [Gaiellaceae bacterium]